MSLLFRKPESRALSFQQVWGSGSDMPTSDPLSLVPVYAATAYIADQFASAPWSAFQKSGVIPVKVTSQPGLLTDPGVNRIDLYSWKFQLFTSLGLWGNAYGYVLTFDKRGVPEKVAWLAPDKMVVDESGPIPRYLFKGAEIDRELLIHIPWYVVPGSVVGLSPVGLFRTQIETGLEAQRVARNSFKRGLVPAGVLRNNKATLTAEQAGEARRRFVASTSSNEPFVAGMDWEYTAIGLPQTDVNFLTGLKANATQIAAIYRIPPEKIGGEVSGSSLTYASLEQDTISFNTTTMRPIATRVESVIDRYLPASEYVRFNLDAAVRADLKTRYEAHQIAIAAGFKTKDEVRALEELPPLTAAQLAQQAV